MTQTMYPSNTQQSKIDDSNLLIWQDATNETCQNGQFYQAEIYEEPSKFAKVTNNKLLLQVSNETNKLEEYFKKKVSSLKISTKWRKEGVLPPNWRCKQITIDFLLFVFNRFDLMPDKIASTIEGGIFIKYQNVENERELIVEVYNDYDIAALISQNKTTLGAFDINNIEKEFTSIVNLFNESTVS